MLVTQIRLFVITCSYRQCNGAAGQQGPRVSQMIVPRESFTPMEFMLAVDMARIIWSWRTISSRTSQHDNIVGHWLDTTISLCWSVVTSYTRVQSVGPYNLTLSRPAVLSRRESSRRPRGGNERPTWLVSWPTQTKNRTGRSQRTDREISRWYHDIVSVFLTIRALVVIRHPCSVTSSSTSQPISVIIHTLVIHHSFSLSLQAQNLPFQQSLPTVDFFNLLDCLTITGLDRIYYAHHFIFSFTF